MTIFIPVLWICLNTHCEFMQQSQYLINENECKEQVIKQKEKLRQMAKETSEEITVLEGTCIDATIKKMMVPYAKSETQ